MSSTYFDTIKRSYTNVTITDDGINTSEFLEATEGVIKLFDLLGSSAFAIVQKDMNGNVEKIRKRLQARPTEAITLENLVKDESKEKKKTATEGLLWLNRALEFTSTSLRRSIEDPTEELNTSFVKGYENSLKSFHGWAVRQIFTVAMKACPYRKDFYAKFGEDQTKVDKQMREWLDSLEKVTKQIDTFYKTGGYDKGPF